MSQPGLICIVNDIKVQKLVQRLIKKMNDLSPAMEEIGEMGIASIKKTLRKADSELQRLGTKP